MGSRQSQFLTSAFLCLNIPEAKHYEDVFDDAVVSFIMDFNENNTVKCCLQDFKNTI